MLPEGWDDITAPALQCPEPWNCNSCGELMYNLGPDGYPAAGAPMPHFWSLEHSKVCSACYSMALTIGTSKYWKDLHAADRDAQARRKYQNDRLTGKRDYFTGA